MVFACITYFAKPDQEIRQLRKNWSLFVTSASVNISSAWFDNSLERLYVNFSGSAKRTDQNNDDCSIFTPETVSKLGSNPTCVFQSSRPNSLKIQLGAAFSLRPGNNLVLADGKINSTYSGTPVVGMGYCVSTRWYACSSDYYWGPKDCGLMFRVLSWSRITRERPTIPLECFIVKNIECSHFTGNIWHWKHKKPITVAREVFDLLNDSSERDCSRVHLQLYNYGQKHSGLFESSKFWGWEETQTIFQHWV